MYSPLIDILFGDFIISKKYIYGIFIFIELTFINMNDFRQEEIWFIEKNNLGESQLRPLSNFNLKSGQDTIKAYLSGRFGAIPMLRRDY